MPGGCVPSSYKVIDKLEIYSTLDSYVEGAVKWELQKSWSVGRTVGPQ